MGKVLASNTIYGPLALSGAIPEYRARNKPGAQLMCPTPNKQKSYSNTNKVQ